MLVWLLWRKVKKILRKENNCFFILFYSHCLQKNYLKILIFSYFGIFMDDQTKRTTFYESKKCKVYKKILWRMFGMKEEMPQRMLGRLKYEMEMTTKPIVFFSQAKCTQDK